MKTFFKKIILIVFIGIMATVAFGAKIFKYFSPNNDGVRDVLSIPFSVTDDSRILSWKMVIENSKGKIVRTIGNKVSLPSKMNAAEMLKQIGKAKEDVIIPKFVSWDGTFDDGTVAPDGEYFYYISATDENGNVSKTKKLSVILDNTLPSAEIKNILEDDLIFGEGEKSSLQIIQSGSSEKQWTGKISDSSGKTVKTIFWKNSSPKKFEWNGTDDNGLIVSDGVYNYALLGEDKAGNISKEYVIKNIIFSAEKPITNISINGSKFFSVESQSEINSIKFDVTIPIPKEKSANKLVEWDVTVYSKENVAVKTFDQNNFKITESNFVINFDGKDNNGKQIPDGVYFAKVKAKYLNGYETHPVSTSPFMFDSIQPVCSIVASDNIFSPDGDSKKDVINFNISADRKNGSPMESWTAKIVDANNSDLIVKEYNFGEFCPTTLEWNGLDSNGKLALDGNYYFVIKGKDMAGNTVISKTQNSFRLDTSKTEVVLSVNELIFSPNEDGVKDSIEFKTSIKQGTSVAKYNFQIKNQEGKILYSQNSNALVPEKILWKGIDNNKNILTDGIYNALLTIESTNGSIAKSEIKNIVIDTKKPNLEISAKDLIFSPDADNIKDSFVYELKNCTFEKLWEISVLDSNKKNVKSFKINNSVNQKKDFKLFWTGTDEAGKKVPDGKFSIKVSSTDEAGNSFSKVIDNIVMDSRIVKAYVTCAFEGISSLSKTGLTEQKFSLRTSVLDGIKSWKFDVVDEKGLSVYSVTDEKKILPKEIIWNGKKSNGENAEGKFFGQLSMEYEKGNNVLEKSSVFVCSNILPKLTVETNPKFFSPDNDGIDDDLFIKLDAVTQGKIVDWSFTILNPNESGKKDKPFWTTSGGNKITEQITWNGLSNIYKESNGQAERVQSAMDYPWKFVVTDSLGMTSTMEGKISIDILVNRDGNVLKMAVPAIIFRANHADFKTAKEAKGSKVTEQQAKNNERVLKRVAKVLEKFPDYTVTVVGHANNITGTEAEETSTENGNIPLIPLSQDRAEFVKAKLVSYGIDASRLKTEGKGGRERIAALKDRENWWKNRRVEFILHK